MVELISAEEASKRTQEAIEERDKEHLELNKEIIVRRINKAIESGSHFVFIEPSELYTMTQHLLLSWLREAGYTAIVTAMDQQLYVSW